MPAAARWALPARLPLLTRLLSGALAALVFLGSAAPTLANEPVWIEVKKGTGGWQKVHRFVITEGESLHYRLGAKPGITTSGGPDLLRSPDANARLMGVGDATNMNQAFIAGVARTQRTLQSTDNGTREADGVVTLSVEMRAGTSGYTIGTPSTVTVIVQDNDTTFTLSTANLTVEEGALTLFTVTADANLLNERDVPVRLFSRNGHTFDQESPTGTLIDAGTRSAPFPVTVTDDNVFIRDQQFLVEILEGPWKRGDPYRLLMQAVDNDTGDPDVNASGSVDASDALILYYSYSLRNDLGTGR